jgi:bacillithiol biosynthesis cysteine-adding enzyme BshC
LSLRIISTPITGSALARIAIDGGDGSWFPRRPTSAGEWKERSSIARESLLSSDWLAAISPAIDATGRAAERLERAASSGIAITAGQQPGLFGGPLYTWWKALSALAFADRLEQITGLPVVPIYWAATDDSDFAEAAYTVVQSSEGAERLEMHGDSAAGTPLSDVPVGDLSQQLERLRAAAGSAPDHAVLDIVRTAYAPGHTVGSAYVEMLRVMLEPLGIPVLDAAHPSIRAAAYPLLRRSLERAGEIEEALAVRTRELKAAGHSIQVKLVKGRTLVFREYAGTRERVRMRDARDALTDGSPESFSANVLLRPVVERSIIPTAAYAGGPAEIAYFAQTTAVAEALGVPAPLIIPRWSGIVVEPKIEKILERYGLAVQDFRDPHAVETRIAHASLPASIKENLADLRESLSQGVERLSQSDGADLVTPSVVEGLGRSIAHRLERVERRFRASVKRRGNEALRDVATARAALFPSGTPQERALNIVPLLARHGEELISAVLGEARQHAERLL